ncbi:MAG TPA: energy transducer TonB [Candidatus Acidoferrales bacterium]
MKQRLAFVGLVIALALGGIALQPLKASAQDAANDAMKRRVRTKVEPQYPATAKQMNISGRVKLEATISADGRVVSTRVVGGSPFLVNAALDALKQWRFEPASRESTEIFEFDFNRSGDPTAP